MNRASTFVFNFEIATQYIKKLIFIFVAMPDQAPTQFCYFDILIVYLRNHLRRPILFQGFCCSHQIYTLCEHAPSIRASERAMLNSLESGYCPNEVILRLE